MTTKSEDSVDQESSGKALPESLEDEMVWLQASENRVGILLSIKQPLTTTQLARKADLQRNRCNAVLKSLAGRGLIRRLNPAVKNWCLYWLTSKGATIQKEQLVRLGREPFCFDFPRISDWELYAWCCHTHRAAIIKAMNVPMQPSAIRRRASALDPHLRMSANNTRDVIRLLCVKDIVFPTFVRKKHHPRYELTELGKKIQILLWGA